MRIHPLLLVIALMTSFVATADVVGAAAPPSPPVPGETQSLQQYKVRSGDTLWGIAQSYGISVPDLLAANKLTGREVIAVGRLLVLPAAAAPAAAGTNLPTAKAPPWQHVVRAGDTPWDVAVSYGVTVDALLAANHLTKNPLLSVGQVLLLPAGAVAPRPRPVPSPTPVPATAPLTVTQALSTTVVVTASGSIGDATAVQADGAVTSTETAPSDEPPPPDDVDLVDPGDEPATDIQADAVISGTETITDTTDAVAANLPAAIGDWPQQVFNGINAKRAANGLPPLTWSLALAQAAQAHAEDCSQRRYGGHVGSDGAHLRTRLARVGIRPAYTSENWVFARAAQSAVDWWFNERAGHDPHRRNILSSRYTTVGIGVAIGELGHYYFIADFASS